MLASLRVTLTVAIALVATPAVPALAAQSRPTPSDVGPLAGGGGFVMQSCGESGSTAGWSLSRPNPGAIDGGLECPPARGHVASQPASFDQTGLWITDRLGNAGGDPYAAVDDRAELSFAPLGGTTITRLRYWRKVFTYADANWQPYIAIGSRANIVDTCEVDDDVACQVGADDWYPNDGDPDADRTAYADRQGLSASAILIGLTCRPNPDNLCGAGFSIPNTEAQIYSAFLTIADTIAPTLGTPAGTAWNADDWLQANQPLSVSSTDTTGILATSLYADGSLIATSQRACTYDRPRPCTDEPIGALVLPTAALPDGPHVLEIAATDAAGNEARVTRPTTLRVDNNAPSPPVGLTSPATTSTTNSFAASWALPADLGSPIVAAHYQLCQGGSCGPVSAAPTTTAVSGLTLAAAGTAKLRVWLIDQLGHQDSTTAATLALTYTPAVHQPDPGPPPPQPPPPDPKPHPPIVKGDAKLKIVTARRSTRGLTIRGSLSAKASGRVTVRYRVRLHRRTRTVSKRVAIARHAFKATLPLSKAIGAVRSGTVSVIYAGDADTKSATRSAIIRAPR
jgi:hypothetical protein